MDLKLDRVNSSSMEIFTKEISLMDSSMEEENISLMKLVKSMKVISTRTKSTEVDWCFGPMAQNTKVNTNTVKWKVMV